MNYLNQQMDLRPENIDRFSEQMTEVLSGRGLDRKDILRIRLAIEELLLRVRDRFGDEQICQMKISRTFRNLNVEVTYKGASFNPTPGSSEDGEVWSEKIMENMGLAPAWSYSRGTNRLVLCPPASGKRGMYSFLIAIAAGLFIGLLGTLLPEGFRTRADGMVLTPVFNAFLGLLGTFTGLMVFFSIISGISGISDTASFGKIGRMMLTRFCGLTFLWSAVISGLCMVFYSIYFGIVTEGQSQIGQVLAFIYGILPSDPFSAFIKGDFRQIVFLAIFIGTSLLILGSRGEGLKRGAEQLNALFLLLVKRVCGFLPIFVFVTLLRLLWSGSVQMLTGLWKPLLVCVTACAVLIVVKACVTGIRLRVHPRVIIRKLVPTFLICFVTASSAAAFSPTKDNCEERLGISPKLTQVGIPIGNVLCMPAATAAFLSVIFYLAEIYHTPVDMGWILTTILMTAVIAIAMPPIPGALLTCFGILLSQLSIPSEGIVVMGILSIFLDMLCTAAGNSYLQMELSGQAQKLNLLDEEKLRKEKE